MAWRGAAYNVLIALALKAIKLMARNRRGIEITDRRRRLIAIGHRESSRLAPSMRAAADGDVTVTHPWSPVEKFDSTNIYRRGHKYKSLCGAWAA